jgi:signal transduction histidine kinase
MRRQLVLMTFAVTSIVVLAFMLPLAWLVHTIAADQAVSRADADAQSVAQLIVADRRNAPTIVAQADVSSIGQISVYYPNGVVIGDRSRPPAADSVELATRGRSFRRRWPGGLDVFLPVLSAPGQTAVVRVAVSNHALERGVWQAWWLLTALGVILIGVAVLVADRMARSITRPMQTLTEIAGRLADGDLDARSRVQGSPEVVEVSRALDALAERIGQLLAAEREHAADLSHTLRTPLTALRLAVEHVRDNDEAERLTTAVDDLEDAVTNIIADTRRGERASSARGVDLTIVVRERLAFWTVLTRAQRRAFETALHDGPLEVDARRRDVEELVDVVVGNVLRHTEPWCAARVTTTRGATGGGHLIVEDAGSGLHANTSTSRGSGRGLDIARRIAGDSGGTVMIGQSDLGGTRVDIELGPCQS